MIFDTHNDGFSKFVDENIGKAVFACHFSETEHLNLKPTRGVLEFCKPYNSLCFVPYNKEGVLDYSKKYPYFKLTYAISEREITAKAELTDLYNSLIQKDIAKHREHIKFLETLQISFFDFYNKEAKNVFSL